MKRKRLGAIILALMLAFSTSVPAFAAGETQIGSQTEMAIPSESIMEVVEENSNIDPTCPWTADTQVKEVIPTYDLDNQVNGYILNLSTDGADTGYLVYNISSGEPVLMEFGYEGVYSIQGEEVTQDSKLGKSKLIPVGINEYVLQKGNDLYTVQTNTKITDQKEEIQKVLEEKETNIAEYVQSEQMVSTLSTRAQEIYSSVSVPGLFTTSGYKPLVMNATASCGAFCNVNILKYWHECRNISSLYNSYDKPNLQQTVRRMSESVKDRISGGAYATSAKDAFDGMTLYGKKYGCTLPKSSARKIGYNWTWIKTQIDKGNPFFLSTNTTAGLDTKDGAHAFFGVGYQDTSTGKFIRVSTLWDTSFSHFYNCNAYAKEINAMFSFTW